MYVRKITKPFCNVQRWTDYRLTWSASDYGDTDYIFVRSSKIWTPQLLLNNT